MLSHNFSFPFSTSSDQLILPKKSKGFSASSAGKESTCNAGDPGSILGGGHGNPLQYSHLENPMDRGAW